MEAIFWNSRPKETYFPECCDPGWMGGLTQETRHSMAGEPGSNRLVITVDLEKSQSCAQMWKKGSETDADFVIVFLLAGVAQLVEQRTCNAWVAGSNPVTSFFQIEHQTLGLGEMLDFRYSNSINQRWNG